MAKSKSVEQFVVVSNGLVDVESSVQNYREALNSYLTEKANENLPIQEVISKVMPIGRTLTKDQIVMAVVLELKTPLEGFGKVSKQVTEFLKDNSEFISIRGASGGYLRK